MAGIEMELELTPKIAKASRVVGQTLVFRDATVNDAEFILSLRSDAKKSKYLSATSNDLRLQEVWLEEYVQKNEQAYFIIENKVHEALGTVRLYGAVGDSFCWGSWIVKAGAAPIVAIESALMVYSYALGHLGFKTAYFDVRQGNESVWQFHERFGARRIDQNETDIYFEISNEAILNSLRRYRKYLSTDVIVT